MLFTFASPATHRETAKQFVGRAGFETLDETAVEVVARTTVPRGALNILFWRPPASMGVDEVLIGRSDEGHAPCQPSDLVSFMVALHQGKAPWWDSEGIERVLALGGMGEDELGLHGPAVGLSGGVRRLIYVTALNIVMPTDMLLFRPR